jgi:hypothetical protein
MRLDTKKVDRILLDIADKVGVYISIDVNRSVHPDYGHGAKRERTVESTNSLYLGHKVKLEDGTIIDNNHTVYESSKKLFDTLILLKKGVKIDE